MNGHERSSRFRTLELREGRPRTPVIFAMADAAVPLPQAQAPGADALLTKPFTTQSLWEAVHPWRRGAVLIEAA